MVIKSYKEATSDIINAIKSHNFSLSDVAVLEAGSVLDLRIPSPFVYVHFDIGGTEVMQGYVIDLVAEFFVGVEAESSAKAKADALSLATELIELMRSIGIKFGGEFIEFFTEFANRGVVKVTGVSKIKLI